MAVRIISKVWDGYPGGGSELLVLLALADWSDDAGKCWPSITSIGRKARLSSDQARRVTHRLIESGFLQVVSGKDGGRSSRRYQIQLDKLTPCMDATPSMGARGGTDATPPLAPAQGHPLHSYASRTVIEPSISVKKVSRSKKSEVTLKQFLESCKANGEKAIPENDPVFEYARTIGLPDEFIFLGWQAFKAKQDADKLQKDWRKTFANYVRNPDWLGVWKLNRDGEFYLTDAGKQIERELAGAAS